MLKKNKTKNTGIMPVVPGSIKRTIKAKIKIRIAGTAILAIKFFGMGYNDLLYMDLIFIIILILGFIVIGYLITKKQKPSNDLLEYLKTTNTRLEGQSKNFNERLDNAAYVISQVQKNIGEMSEIGRSMKSLQEFLQSPKLRGNIGEQVLTQILTENLPKNTFNLQYSFKSGAKVDVAIKTAAGIIPIDSKFPLENFRKMMKDPAYTKEFEKDVKKHIDDIAHKYILTDEGTIDYALMYIPSEAVYYEIANNPDLFEYSNKMRVLPVSPTTFYAYMKAILMSFEGQKIEQKAKEILSTLRAVQKDYEKTEEDLNIMQKHLTGAFNKMGDVFASFGRLGGKISQTKNLEE